LHLLDALGLHCSYRTGISLPLGQRKTICPRQKPLALGATKSKAGSVSDFGTANVC